MVQELYNFPCSIDRLRKLYLDRHITYRFTSKSWKVSEEEEVVLNQERKVYAEILHGIKEEGKPLIYFDETSFDNWDVKTRSWAHKSQALPQLINPVRFKGITVYGACGNILEKPLFMTGKSTNTEETLKFLQLIE